MKKKRAEGSDSEPTLIFDYVKKKEDNSAS